MRNFRSGKDVLLTAELSTILRLAAYTVFIFILTLLLPAIVKSGDVSAFKEGGVIEWYQFSLLMATSALFFLGGNNGSQTKHLFYLLSCLSLFAAIRELDSLADRLIPLIGWKIGYLLLIYALLAAHRNRKILYLEIGQWLKNHSVIMLWAGFLFVVPVGQLVGHGTFLQSLMGDDYLRDYKRVLEEVLELIGYIVILTGSIEAVMPLSVTGQTKRMTPVRLSFCFRLKSKMICFQRWSVQVLNLPKPQT